MIATHIPVIAIDGPSASGKGTVAERVAGVLGFHYLDSGAIYRLAALAALKRLVSLDDEAALARIGAELNAKFEAGRVLLDDQDATDAIRAESVGSAASKIAVYPALRTALLERQRAFRQPPGLVADGRDMGSVVFPDATLKVFLTAGVDARADRRYKQLIDKGNSANLAAISAELRERDRRDRERAAAPLKQCEDQHLLDTSGMSIEAAVDWVLARFRAVV